jgi:hypothetical protein
MKISCIPGEPGYDLLMLAMDGGPSAGCVVELDGVRVHEPVAADTVAGTVTVYAKDAYGGYAARENKAEGVLELERTTLRGDVRVIFSKPGFFIDLRNKS